MEDGEAQLLIPALKWRQEDPKFKVFLDWDPDQTNPYAGKQKQNQQSL